MAMLQLVQRVASSVLRSPIARCVQSLRESSIREISSLRTLSSISSSRKKAGLRASRSVRPRKADLGVTALSLAAEPATTSINIIPLQPLDITVSPGSALSEQSPAYTLLARTHLGVTRQLEMMNVLLGYEQANKYAIKDETGADVGYIAEEDTFGKSIARQLLRTHRKFHAAVLDLQGKLVLSIQRPFSFINSKIYIASSDGQHIGEVHQEWHLWRRKYSLFNKDNVQFAQIDAPLLSWAFELVQDTGETRALIDRNFTGFAREIFTDTGHYAVHFTGPGTDLTLDERAVALAAAVTIDVDYFSRNRGGIMGTGGMPLIMPMGGGSGGGEAGIVAGNGSPTDQGTSVDGLTGVGGATGNGSIGMGDSVPPFMNDSLGAQSPSEGTSKWGDQGWDVPDNQSGDTDGDGEGVWSWMTDLLKNTSDD